VPHTGSKHRYTFYPAAIGGLVGQVGRLTKKEEPSVKHIGLASGEVLPAAKLCDNKSLMQTGPAKRSLTKCSYHIATVYIILYRCKVTW